MPNHRRRTPAQLELFTPGPEVPRWKDLPARIRQKIETQLAQLIVQYANQPSTGKESDDE